MKAIYVSARDQSAKAHLAHRPIAEVMSKPPVTIAADAILDDALIKMISTGLRHLAVVGTDGRCVGILSDRTIASAWATNYNALTHGTVAMCLDVHMPVVGERSHVVDAARLMHDTAIDAVAVVDAEGRPVGVVTGSDLVSLLAK